MQKPQPEDYQWLMITPVVADSIKYLVQITDQLLKDNNRLAGFQSEIQQRFQTLQQNTTQTVMKLGSEASKATELSLSNASKIQHIYSICSQAENRMNKTEQQLKADMAELSSGLYETLGLRTADLTKMIELKQQQFQVEFQKNAQAVKASLKYTEDKLALISQNAALTQKKVDDLQLDTYARFYDVRRSGEQDQARTREIFESKDQIIARLRQEMERDRAELSQLKGELAAQRSAHAECHAENYVTLAALKKSVGEYQNVPARLDELNFYVKSLGAKLEQLLAQNEHQPDRSRPQQQDYVLYTVLDKLEYKADKTAGEQQMLGIIREYDAKKRSGGYDAEQIEQIKAQVMQTLLASDLLDEDFLDELIGNMGELTADDQREIDATELAAYGMVERVGQRAGLDYDAAPTAKTDNRQLQFATYFYRTPKNANSYQNAASAASGTQFREEADFYMRQNAQGAENQRFGRDADAAEVNVDQQLDAARELLHQNQLLQYQYAQERVSSGSRQDSHSKNAQFSQQQYNQSKNVQMQIADFKTQLKTMQAKHEDDMSQLRSFVDKKLGTKIMQKMSECGLADFLQLDQQQNEDDDALSVKSEAFCQDDAMYARADLFMYKKFVGDAEGYRRGRSTGQKALNSPVGSQSMKYFPKQDALGGSFSAASGSYNLDLKDPASSKVPKQPQGAKFGLLNKNFINSYIYRELRAELQKSVSVEGELLFQRYMKEVARIDRLVEMESQEIINVEERLRKLFQSHGGASFRRSAASAAGQVSRGVQINVQKPVMLIGYTGESK